MEGDDESALRLECKDEGCSFNMDFAVFVCIYVVEQSHNLKENTPVVRSRWSA
jgi:hypothetical protein